MRIMNNISAMNAHRLYTSNNSKLSKSLEKLSSGYAINRAGDNAAGLAVSEKMRAQIAGLEQASKNAQDGISMVQTYEGALTETDSILQRMRSLAVQSANGTYDNSVDRVAIEQEFKQLNDELDQIADTDFNGVIVLNGGKMADGTVVDGNGIIDYSSAVRKPQQLGTSTGVGVGVIGIGKDGYIGTKKETVTFTASVDADGKVTWDAGDAEGNLAMNSKNGGFSYNGATIHVNTDKVLTGDTLVVEFNPATTAKGVVSEVTGSTTTADKEIGKGTFNKAALSITATDATVTSAEIADAINSLNGLTIKTTTSAGTTPNPTSTVNGKTVDTNGTAINDKVFAKADDTGLITLYAGADANGTAIGTISAATVTGNDATTKAGDYTTVWNVSTSTYTAAKNADIKVLEPDAKVSQSNANSTASGKLTYANGMTLQVGSRTKDLVDFTFAYDADSIGELDPNLDCSSRGLGTNKLTLATQEDANTAIDKIDHAINKVSMVRGTFGAIQNRLEHKINNLDTNTENLSAAESRIRDTDMAAEMMEFTKNQILSQASQSMLAQANQLPQGVLSLLQ